MKKNNLLILAVAALGFAACANDETTAVNEKLAESNAISFRTFVGGQMRAADITTDNLASFKAYALKNNTTTVYFAEDVFTKQGTTFTSANKHYWPSSGALDFFAYAPTTSTQYTHETTEDLQFVVTPSATASEQVDLVVANTDNKTKTGTYGESKQYGADGIPLNFRHAEAKVSIQFKNSNPNLYVTVKDAEICYLNTTGTYTYSGSANGTDTDGNGTDNLKFSDWTGKSGTGSYKQTLTTPAGLSSADEAATLPTSFILIPQQLNAATQYSATGSGKAFQGAYIKAKIKIQNGNTSSGDYIIGSDGDADGNYQTAMWPLQQITWNPGYHYIYTVDLAGGGYFETNQDEEIGLDPILAGAEIKFVTVTVDTWDEANYTVGNMVYVSGGSHAANIVAAAGEYTVTITGLGAGETVSTVAVTGEGAAASPTTGTAGSDGTFSFGLTVAANASTVSTKTFTITVTPATSSATTITLTQAAAN